MNKNDRQSQMHFDNVFVVEGARLFVCHHQTTSKNTVSDFIAYFSSVLDDSYK
jgi:hypothetical protein